MIKETNFIKKVIGIFLFLIGMISSAQNTVLFEQGNTMYNDGEYLEAISKYEKILGFSVHSAELYFNLANAHYKLNHIAPSIYYYEKALQLAPNDADIKTNMAFSRNMTLDAIDVIPEIGLSKVINNASNSMSFDTWAILAICFVVFSVLCFISYYLSQSTKIKRTSFTFGFVCLFLMVGMTAFAFHKYNLDKNANPAIVFAQESKVKSEPNLRSDEVFKLHEGNKVQVLDTVKNWKKIKLSDGKTGWIISTDIKLLKEQNQL